MSEPWTCAALKQGTAGGNVAPDCGWPSCGCDPKADKVIEALEASGAFDPRGLNAALADAHERIAQLTQALAPFAAAADDVDDAALDRSRIWEMPCAMNITVGDLRTALRMVGHVGRAPT